MGMDLGLNQQSIFAMFCYFFARSRLDLRDKIPNFLIWTVTANVQTRSGRQHTL